MQMLQQDSQCSRDGSEQRSSAVCRPSSAIARAVACDSRRHSHVQAAFLQQARTTPPVYGPQDSRIERVPVTGSEQDSHEVPKGKTVLISM